MATNVRRSRRGASPLETRRQEFLLAQETKRADEQTKVSPVGVLAFVTILGLGALWATGMLPALLIQLLLGGG